MVVERVNYCTSISPFLEILESLQKVFGDIVQGLNAVIELGERTTSFPPFIEWQRNELPQSFIYNERNDLPTTLSAVSMTWP
jgi:hypothetical protein